MKLRLPVHRPPREFDPALLEMMDRPDSAGPVLEEDLRNIRRINRWLGGHRLVRSELRRFLSRWTSSFGKDRTLPTCRILDLATGSADIPRLVADECRERGIAVEITATDRNPRILEIARRECRHHPEIILRPADVLAPDFEDASYDWVTCHLALHHFSVEQAVAILRNLWRITRAALLVNDLDRSRLLQAATKTLIPWISSNPMTRFDAALSTRRAFTWDEMRRLAFHANIPSPTLRRYFFSRQALTAWK